MGGAFIVLVVNDGHGGVTIVDGDGGVRCDSVYSFDFF